MQNTKTKLVEREYIESVTCDVCQRTFDDVMDLQEMIFISFTGGYTSVFGDETTVEIDICQECFKDKLGEYVRLSTQQ